MVVGEERFPFLTSAGWGTQPGGESSAAPALGLPSLASPGWWNQAASQEGCGCNKWGWSGCPPRVLPILVACSI